MLIDDLQQLGEGVVAGRLKLTEGTSLVDLYTSLATRLPYMSKAALYQLTIPTTNTVAERGFSKMKNLDVPNRRAAGTAYTRTLLFLSCNAEWYTH